ncbi:hypothetical protein Bca101_093857 [Brassica carinata]
MKFCAASVFDAVPRTRMASILGEGRRTSVADVTVVDKGCVGVIDVNDSCVDVVVVDMRAGGQVRYGQIKGDQRGCVDMNGVDGNCVDMVAVDMRVGGGFKCAVVR